MTDLTLDPVTVPPRFDGLRALFIHATLKRSPEPSHTEGLARVSSDLLQVVGLVAELILLQPGACVARKL
ncbi:hypothetical protein ACFYQA_08740 [Streptomyces sp. NPDC005774]|uniref:hypothetical protein n=1 Tax=Streptomyces sp. NPDC005774 TaxID=3364728 RepID=UPI0036AD2B0B